MVELFPLKVHYLEKGMLCTLQFSSQYMVCITKVANFHMHTHEIYEVLLFSQKFMLRNKNLMCGDGGAHRFSPIFEYSCFVHFFNDLFLYCLHKAWAKQSYCMGTKMHWAHFTLTKSQRKRKNLDGTQFLWHTLYSWNQSGTHSWFTVSICHHSEIISEIYFKIVFDHYIFCLFV